MFSVFFCLISSNGYVGKHRKTYLNGEGQNRNPKKEHFSDKQWLKSLKKSIKIISDVESDKVEDSNREAIYFEIITKVQLYYWNWGNKRKVIEIIFSIGKEINKTT